MKPTFHPNKLKYLVLCCGVLGLFLRYTLYATGTDNQGLLLHSHWASIALWLLTGLVLAALVCGTHSIEGPESGFARFPASILAGVGCTVASVATLISTLSEIGNVSFARTVFGIAATAILSALAVYRFFGIRTGFLLHATLCLYFTMRMVFQYRNWSGDPQLMDYCFELFACVGLMLASYQQGAFGVGLGSCGRAWFWNLLTAYLCCLTLAGPGRSLSYLAYALWLLGDLQLPESTSHQAAAPTQEQEGDPHGSA